MDCRTASSRCRITARASIRLATFAQTMSKVMSVTAVTIAMNRRPCLPPMGENAVAE
jgi:hypothetical protein